MNESQGEDVTGDGDGKPGDGKPGDGGGPRIVANRATSDRVVFTEEGNTDGWIATDRTVSPDP